MPDIKARVTQESRGEGGSASPLIPRVTLGVSAAVIRKGSDDISQEPCAGLSQLPPVLEATRTDKGMRRGTFSKGS